MRSQLVLSTPSRKGKAPGATRTSKQIAEATAAYLAKGGKVQRIKRGESGIEK